VSSGRGSGTPGTLRKTVANSVSFVVDGGTSEHGTATENPNAGGPFASRRERRSFALGYRCEHPDGRSPRMLVRRQRDEGIRPSSSPFASRNTNWPSAYAACPSTAPSTTRSITTSSARLSSVCLDRKARRASGRKGWGARSARYAPLVS
jgi:hypothetical protein